MKTVGQLKISVYVSYMKHGQERGKLVTLVNEYQTPREEVENYVAQFRASNPHLKQLEIRFTTIDIL